MDVDDIVRADGEAQNSGLSAEGRGFTAHFFGKRTRPEGLGCRARQAVRVPDDTSSWPPNVLFDAVYGITVARHFGKLEPDVLKRCRPNSLPDAARHGQPNIVDVLKMPLCFVETLRKTPFWTSSSCPGLCSCHQRSGSVTCKNVGRRYLLRKEKSWNQRLDHRGRGFLGRTDEVAETRVQ